MNSNTEPLTADPQIMQDWATQHFGATPPGLLAVCSTRNFAGIRTADIGNLVQWAMTEDRAGVQGIYVRVTTIAPGSVTSGRGKAADSHALIDMWSDLDFGDDGHKTTGLPKDAAEAADIPAFAGLPAATETHHSGGGLYKRWKLTTPAVIGEDLDLATATQFAADWQNILLLGAKKMGNGYGTGVKDLARVLRLPGTINRKPGRTPAMCQILDASGPSYTLEELLEFADRLKPKPEPRPTPPAAAPPVWSAKTSSPTTGGPGPIQILGEHACAGEILSFVGCTYHQQEPGNCSYCGPDCQQWLRPGWAPGASTTGIAVHKGGAAVTIRTDNFPGLPGDFVNKVLSPGQLFAALHHGGNLSAASADIRRAAEGHPSASAAASALPPAVLADVRATRPAKSQHLSIVSAPQTEAPIDGTAALQPDAAAPDNDQDEREEQGAEEAPKPFDFGKAFGLPADTKTPYGYRVDNRGVWVKRLMGKDKDEAWVRFAFTPVVIKATFEDPDGEQYVELSWIDRSRKFPRLVTRIVSREIAKRGRKLIEHLGGAGLPAVEGDARVLERWLAEFEAANLDRIPSERLARRLGWQPDGTFVSSPEDGTKVDVVYEEMREVAKAHGRKGTFDDWQGTVKTLEKFPVPRIAIAAALAASLLRPLGINSFTLDISSRSTKGKTTALQCALSVWANPSEHSSAMSNWRTTLYAIEKRLNLVQGIVTVFDETMAVSDDTLIDEVLYQLPMNHGKARSGGAFGNMLPWETILLSSGERPALSFTTSQGAAARILGTTIPPFGNNGGETAVKAREGVLANFGHAGPAFVQHLQDGLAKPNGHMALKDRHRDLTDKFRGDSDMTGRRAPMVAVLALAEALACKWGVLPYEPLPEEKWQRMFAAHNPTDNRPEMAMDVVREYIASHSWELWPGDSDRPPYTGWLGVMKGTADKPSAAVLPERLRKILESAGYSLDAVLDGWIAAGYLEVRDSQRPKHLIPARFAGTRARCITFTPQALDVGADEAEAA
ncbi:DUF927 domain-containing protein [Streptomyces sp. NPDC060064]|uniref:DUF927 domain-containing protein n=1 Tax=Streptomyces sp. NPDC060064 TaxID=3347049 RepID=UPI0036852064